MKQNKISSQIIIFGIVIISIFTYVVTINLIDNNSGERFFAKDKEMQARIEKYYFDNKKLVVETSGDADYACIKTTRSQPEKNSVCWTKIKDNKVSINIYDYKSYYIWIRDANGSVSDAVKYNPKDVK